jgi:PAS domain S-box-containing protein
MSLTRLMLAAADAAGAVSGPLPETPRRLTSALGSAPLGRGSPLLADAVWLPAGCDAVLALAFLAILAALIYLVSKRPDLRRNRTLALLALFAAGCAATQALNVAGVWYAVPGLDAVVTAITAVLALAATAALWPLIPHLVATPTRDDLRAANADLQREIGDRQAAQAELRRGRDELEGRIQARTAELAAANAALEVEIAGRERHEAALAESEARKSAILESALDCIISMDHEGRIVDFNPAAERTFGYRREAVVGRTVAETIVPERLRTAHAQGLARFRVSGEGPVVGRRIEMPALRADGTEFPVELAISPTRVEGRPAFFTAYLRDITERKRAEGSMRESEAKFRTLSETVPAMVWVSTPTWERTYVNQRLCAYTGLPQERLLGWGWISVVHPDDMERAREERERCIQTGRTYEVEVRYRRADGVYRWFLSRAEPVRDEEGRIAGWFGTSTDVEDHKRAQAELAAHRDRLEELVQHRTGELERSHQRLRLSERMAAIGTLSAGLGHDMGNLLLPIRTRIDVMKAKGVPEALREDLEAVVQSAEYLQRLTSGLRLLALDPDDAGASGQMTRLESWWGDVASLLKNALPRGTVLETKIPAGLPCAALPPHRLTQAVLNLVSNAGDAIRAGGGSRVTVWAAPGPDEGEGGTVVVGVTDDGPGMTEEVKRRCLEPFFTTKTRKLSTGLGLSLVHGIVQTAGGTMEIDSDRGTGGSGGRGTTVRLTLPAVEPCRPEDDAAGPGAAGERRAALNIRDPRVQAYVTAMLRPMGLVGQPVAGGAEPGAAALWITSDASDASLETARRFLGADGGTGERRVVLLGAAQGGWAMLDGVVCVGSADPGAIRDVLRDVVTALAETGNGRSAHPGSVR